MEFTNTWGSCRSGHIQCYLYSKEYTSLEYMYIVEELEFLNVSVCSGNPTLTKDDVNFPADAVDDFAILRAFVSCKSYNN